MSIVDNYLRLTRADFKYDSDYFIDILSLYTREIDMQISLVTVCSPSAKNEIITSYNQNTVIFDMEYWRMYEKFLYSVLSFDDYKKISNNSINALHLIDSIFYEQLAKYLKNIDTNISLTFARDGLLSKDISYKEENHITTMVKISKTLCLYDLMQNTYVFDEEFDNFINNDVYKRAFKLFIFEQNEVLNKFTKINEKCVKNCLNLKLKNLEFSSSDYYRAINSFIPTVQTICSISRTEDILSFIPMIKKSSFCLYHFNRLFNAFKSKVNKDIPVNGLHIYLLDDLLFEFMIIILYKPYIKEGKIVEFVKSLKSEQNSKLFDAFYERILPSINDSINTLDKFIMGAEDLKSIKNKEQLIDFLLWRE